MASHGVYFLLAWHHSPCNTHTLTWHTHCVVHFSMVRFVSMVHFSHTYLTHLPHGALLHATHNICHMPNAWQCARLPPNLWAQESTVSSVPFSLTFQCRVLAVCYTTFHFVGPNIEHAVFFSLFLLLPNATGTGNLKHFPLHPLQHSLLSFPCFSVRHGRWQCAR